MKLLAKHPGQRYQSAAEVIDALDSPTADVSYARKSILPWKWIGIAAITAGLIALATVVYISTGKGMLVLEVNEPDVKVSVDGARVTIKSPRDSIEVAVGDHELEVTKDGFTSYTQRFRVRRGDKTELVARLESLPATKEPATREPATREPATREPATRESAPAAKENAELTIEVPSTRRWTATGLTLRQDMELRIVASGSVDAAPETDTREYYQQVPPAGRQERIEQFPEPLLPGLGLLGRIGNGRAFFVGDDLSLIVTATDGNGELYLGINDDLVEDNFGAWKVKITTRPASSK